MKAFLSIHMHSLLVAILLHLICQHGLLPILLSLVPFPMTCGTKVSKCIVALAFFVFLYPLSCVCVCVCACVCVRSCTRVCVHTCVRACVCGNCTCRCIKAITLHSNATGEMESFHLQTTKLVDIDTCTWPMHGTPHTQGSCVHSPTPQWSTMRTCWYAQ